MSGFFLSSDTFHKTNNIENKSLISERKRSAEMSRIINEYIDVRNREVEEEKKIENNNKERKRDEVDFRIKYIARR